MIIDDILKPSRIPYKETMFPRTPTGDYAVYMDDVTADGPDDENRIFFHDYTLELYTAKPNPALEADIEARMNARGLKWTKQSRYWVEAAQRYQVVYEFTHITKT